MKKNKTLSIVLISVITVLIALLTFMTFASFPIAGYKNGTYDFVSIVKEIGDEKLSYEFTDGVYYTLKPVNVTDYEDNEVTVEEVTSTIKARLQKLGYTDAVVTSYDDGVISVIVDNGENVGSDMQAVAGYGKVSFRNSDNANVIEQAQIKNAEITRTDTFTGLTITLTKEGKKLMDAESGDVFIYLGEDKLFDTKINEFYNDGVISFGNGSTDANAVATYKRFALQISTGGLDVEFELSNGETISPVYGKISATVIALVVALAVVLVAFAVLYRGFAIAGDLSVLASLLLTLFFIVIIPNITISAGGLVGLVAGALFAVSGVLAILNGIKKEYAKGKTLKASYKQTYGKMTMVMVDMTVLALVVAIVMLLLCTGSLKSFAVTFAISTIVATLVNQLLLRLLVKLELNIFTSEKFFNLKKEEANVNE